MSDSTFQTVWAANLSFYITVKIIQTDNLLVLGSTLEQKTIYV